LLTWIRCCRRGAGFHRAKTVPDLQRIGAKNQPVSNVLAEGTARRATLLREMRPAFRLRCRRRQFACACLSRSPPFERARAAMTYGDLSQDLVLAFKHGDRLDFAPLVVSWSSPCRCTLVVCSGGAKINRPFLPMAWVLGSIFRSSPPSFRGTRRTPTQSGLGRKARERTSTG
jgi:predicted amidophosphoribosyltransferase